MPEEMIREKKSFWIIFFITWRDISNSQWLISWDLDFSKEFYFQLLDAALHLRDRLPSAVNGGHVHQALAMAKISSREA